MNLSSMIPSLIAESNVFNNDQELLSWIKQRNNEIAVHVERIPFKDMIGWTINENQIYHSSKNFFSIQGLHVETDYGDTHSWDQPIINQPEIGYLGIITKEFNGVLYFLMQAKIEPGNVNCVQISPTLQATKSNYRQIHKGKKPAYLDYFINCKPHQILLDQLQSEQGARFLKKRNRNIIIKIDDEIELSDDFKWMTLAQIKKFMHIDNMVNMDTRTVISGINYTDYITPLSQTEQMSTLGKDMLFSASHKEGLFSMNEHLSWLSNLKATYDLFISNKDLNKLSEWQFNDDELSRHDNKFFKVIGVNVHIDNREVQSWCQPLIQPMQKGLCAFIIKKIGNIYHFLVQAKLECGNYDILELAPTVQCLTGDVYKSYRKPYYADYVLSRAHIYTHTHTHKRRLFTTPFNPKRADASITNKIAI